MHNTGRDGKPYRSTTTRARHGQCMVKLTMKHPAERKYKARNATKAILIYLLGNYHLHLPQGHVTIGSVAKKHPMRQEECWPSASPSETAANCSNLCSSCCADTNDHQTPNTTRDGTQAPPIVGNHGIGVDAWNDAADIAGTTLAWSGCLATSSRQPAARAHNSGEGVNSCASLGKVLVDEPTSPERYQENYVRVHALHTWST